MRCGYAPGERCLHHDSRLPCRAQVRGRSDLQSLLMTQGARGGSGVDKFAEANIQSLRKFVAEANIQSLRKQLATATDESIRRTMFRLLAEEEAKLAALLLWPNES